MWVPFSQRVSLWASEEMVCFGNVFWDIGGGIWNLLGSYMYLVCTPGRNLAERSHSRLFSLSPHIQSINKSCQLYFQNVPGIQPPPSPSLTKAAAVISPWVTAVVSQLGFLLLPLSPATCVPHDHQLATGRASSRTFQWVPMSLGEKLPLSPSPPAVLVVWVPLTFWASFPATFPGAVLSVSSLWVPYHIWAFLLIHCMFYLFFLGLSLPPFAWKLWTGVLTVWSLPPMSPTAPGTYGVPHTFVDDRIKVNESLSPSWT